MLKDKYWMPFMLKLTDTENLSTLSDHKEKMSNKKKEVKELNIKTLKSKPKKKKLSNKSNN
jgi:hypothetical protein